MFSIELGPGLELRLPHESNAQELFELTDRNRDHLRRWLPWLDYVKSTDDSLAFIRLSLKRYAENNGFDGLIVYERRIVGVAGLHAINTANQRTAIGYWLDEGFQGKGFMTRAAKALVDYSFKTAGLNRVEIHCAVENEKSRAIPERLGFKLEGILRDNEKLYERFVDSAIYSMLAREWDTAGTGRS